MKVMKVVFASVGIAAAAGCSGGDGGGGETNVVELADFGGSVAVGAGSGTGIVSAVFFTDVTITPDPGPIRVGPTDECVFNGPNPTQAATYLDVGDDVTATSGASTVVAVKNTSGGIYYYGEGTGEADGTFEIAVAGTDEVAAGQIASIRVPPPMVQPSSLTLVPGEPLEVTWTPTDSDVVEFTLHAADFSVRYDCSAEDDGAFTIPADVTTAIGAGGTVSASNYCDEVITLEGRKVIIYDFPLSL